MHWLSIDPATKTGIAHWRGDTLVGVRTLRAAKAHERQRGYALALDVTGLSIGFASMFAAWGSQLAGASAVVIEEGMGGAPKSVAQLGFRRGFIAALCEQRRIGYSEINSKRWKKVVGEHLDDKFPGYSKLDKAHAVALVDKRYPLARGCSSDEADAVLVGLYALLSGTVQP